MLVGPAAKHAPKRQRMDHLMSPPSMGMGSALMRLSFPPRRSFPPMRVPWVAAAAAAGRLATLLGGRSPVRGQRFLIPWSNQHSQFHCHTIIQIHPPSSDSSCRRSSSISSGWTSRAHSRLRIPLQLLVRAPVCAKLLTLCGLLKWAAALLKWAAALRPCHSLPRIAHSIHTWGHRVRALMPCLSQKPSPSMAATFPLGIPPLLLPLHSIIM